MNMRIKPANKTVKVLDPVTRQPLKAAGETKPRTTYWMRRLKDGDIVEMVEKKEGKKS